MKIKKTELNTIIELLLCHHNNDIINESVALLLTYFTAKDIKDKALNLHKEALRLSSKTYHIYPHRDAFRHIVGYGFLVQWIKQSLPGADYVGKMIGELYELKGALRSLVKGGPFDSGWKMDSANNDVGFNLGLKYDIKEDIIKAAKNIVDSGKFYVEDGKTMFDNCGKKTDIGCKVIKPKTGSGNITEEEYLKQLEKYGYSEDN